MGKTLRFFGASDDLFEVTGAITEEIGCFSKPGVYHLKSAEGELLVIALYGVGNIACWTIGVCQVDEGVPVPEWPVMYSMHDSGYSPLLTLEVPDDTRLVMDGDDEDDDR